MKTQIFLVAVAGLFIAGCASTPMNMKEDKLAQAKSQIYMENATTMPVADVKGSCAIPAGAEKVQLNKAGEPSKDWRTLVAAANACVGARNWTTLDQLASYIARNDMDSPWGAYFYSVAAEANKDYSRALWMVDLAQKKAGGRTALFFYQKGHILLSMDETVKGMKELEQALALDPKFIDGQLYLAEIYHRDQQLDLATKYYEGALAIEAKSYRALTGLAEVKLRQNAAPQAIEYYQRAVSAHGQQLQPWVRLAYIYETVQKSPELALSTYKGLKSGLDSGSIKGGRPDVDLPSKIKSLEQLIQSRIPAAAADKKQANAQTPVPLKDAKRSTK